MKKLLALLVVALSSVTLPAQGVWTQETIDPTTGRRTGQIQVNGLFHWIEPNNFLIGADLRGADLSNTDLSNTDLRNALLDGANLRGANLSGTKFRNAFLDNANLDSVILIGADLRGADLSGANLRNGNLGNANLEQAILREADLSRSQSAGANLTGADLFGANLRNANFSRANFSGANLVGADLSGAYLFGANLNEADTGSLLTGLTKANHDEIENLKTMVEANTRKVGITWTQAFSIQSNTTEIAELKTMMEAMSVQMQQLNARLNDQQASIEEKDQQIAELSQRPTLEQIQDARAGSLVFRADEATNAVTLEFEIQSSENLQDWVAQPETVTATVPLDADKKFVRIALAQE